jgi:hypothetical protein
MEFDKLSLQATDAVLQSHVVGEEEVRQGLGYLDRVVGRPGDDVKAGEIGSHGGLVARGLGGEAVNVWLCDTVQLCHTVFGKAGMRGDGVANHQVSLRISALGGSEGVAKVEFFVPAAHYSSRFDQLVALDEYIAAEEAGDRAAMIAGFQSDGKGVSDHFWKQAAGWKLGVLMGFNGTDLDSAFELMMYRGVQAYVSAKVGYDLRAVAHANLMDVKERIKGVEFIPLRDICLSMVDEVLSGLGNEMPEGPQYIAVNGECSAYYDRASTFYSSNSVTAAAEVLQADGEGENGLKKVKHAKLLGKNRVFGDVDPAIVLFSETLDEDPDVPMDVNSIINQSRVILDAYLGVTGESGNEVKQAQVVKHRYDAKHAHLFPETLCSYHLVGEEAPLRMSPMLSDFVRRCLVGLRNFLRAETRSGLQGRQIAPFTTVAPLSPLVIIRAAMRACEKSVIPPPDARVLMKFYALMVSVWTSGIVPSDLLRFYSSRAAESKSVADPELFSFIVSHLRKVDGQEGAWLSDAIIGLRWERRRLQISSRMKQYYVSACVDPTEFVVREERRVLCRPTLISADGASLVQFARAPQGVEMSITLPKAERLEDVILREFESWVIDEAERGNRTITNPYQQLRAEYEDAEEGSLRHIAGVLVSRVKEARAAARAPKSSSISPAQAIAAAPSRRWCDMVEEEDDYPGVAEAAEVGRSELLHLGTSAEGQLLESDPFILPRDDQRSRPRGDRRRGEASGATRQREQRRGGRGGQAGYVPHHQQQRPHRPRGGAYLDQGQQYMSHPVQQQRQQRQQQPQQQQQQQPQPQPVSRWAHIGRR